MNNGNAEREFLFTCKSSLVESYWAGKLLSELRKGDVDSHTPETHNHAIKNPILPSPLCTSQPAVEQPVSSLEKDALHALSVKETSLSPGVHRLLTIPVSDEEMSEFYQNNDWNDILDASTATLDWKVLGCYLLGGKK